MAFWFEHCMRLFLRSIDRSRVLTIRTRSSCRGPHHWDRFTIPIWWRDFNIYLAILLVALESIVRGSRLIELSWWWHWFSCRVFSINLSWGLLALRIILEISVSILQIRFLPFYLTNGRFVHSIIVKDWWTCLHIFRFVIERIVLAVAIVDWIVTAMWHQLILVVYAIRIILPETTMWPWLTLLLLVLNLRLIYFPLIINNLLLKRPHLYLLSFCFLDKFFLVLVAFCDLLLKILC